MKMSKIMAIVIGGLLAVCTMPGLFLTAQGADNDNFTVTMSGRYLEVNIINASWSIGTVLMSHSYWTNASKTQTADVTNSTQGTNIDFEMTISTDSITGWSHGTTPGPNVYRMNASGNTWSTQANLDLTPTYADVHADHDPVADILFDLRFDSPTSTTTGVSQSLTLNGKVTIH